MRKIVYIAHPVSGNVEENLKNAAKWYRWAALAHEEIVIPLMPWFECCYALDDRDPFERAYGISMDRELIHRIPFDECWLCGTHRSKGMEKEVELFKIRGIKIRDFTGSAEPPSGSRTKDS